ncbi:MAG: hypothetical protein PUB24_02190 [Lachnospiraceae bacterium]|nr:hypothetical protein [Lachnospiraceae bacterium]
MFYRECPYCGCNLDPGEHCDCREKKREKEHRLMSLFDVEATGQIKMKVEDFEYAGN